VGFKYSESKVDKRRTTDGKYEKNISHQDEFNISRLSRKRRIREEFIFS
jgi:hypothetical protein